ncbi:MAG: hypothetical protein KKA73_21965, partial [Chloroflexi bacterium]|nr:hypothetical protein [Chloroflexota bacterium]
RKLSTPAPARDLYQGRIFRAALLYAEHHHDATLILSARYGLVHPDQVLAPYDQCLARSRAARRAWVQQVCTDLLNWGARWAPEWQEIYCYAGRTYWADLAPWLRSIGLAFYTPLAGVAGIEAQRAWLLRR